MDEEILDAIEGDIPAPEPYECNIEEIGWYDEVAIARIATTYEGSILDLKFWIKPVNHFDMAFVNSLFGDDDDDFDDDDDLPLIPRNPGGDFTWIGGGDTSAEIEDTEEEEIIEWEIIELDD